MSLKLERILRGTYCVQPHLVDVGAVFIFWQLDTPFTSVFVCFIFPGRDDALLV